MMDEQMVAAIREQLEERNYDMGGEMYSALVELGPGHWVVRTLTNLGQLDEEHVADYLRLRRQAEADPHDEEAAAEAALDKHWAGRNVADDPEFELPAFRQAYELDPALAIESFLEDAIQDAEKVELVADDEWSYKFKVTFETGEVAEGIVYRPDDAPIPELPAWELGERHPPTAKFGIS